MKKLSTGLPGTRMLSIRQWMLVGFAIFLLLAVLFYHIASLLDQNVLQPWMRPAPAQQNGALDSTLREIAGSTASWRDPQWQNSIRATLATTGASMLISDPSGREVFRAGGAGSGGHADREISVVQAGANGAQPLGTVDLFLPDRGGLLPVPVPLLAGVLAVVLAFLFVRTQMGRYVVKPLEAMGIAARRIANGDLNFELPDSRVREVADVSQAFEAMGEGLRDSLRRQAELEEERRFFVGAIAHDLRTPLFSLRGYLEGLEQGLASSPQKAADYIAVCRQKADQLDRLVSDLFAYTRVEYLEQTLRSSPLELGALLRRAVQGAGPRARGKDIALEIVGPAEAGESCMSEGDEQLLERAIENLLDNALQYTQAGGKIEVSWHRDEAAGRAVFTVTDTGPGIAPADMPHLFDPLYRGETSRNRQTGGAGLGLAIARRALLAHGGDLVAANCPGGGAKFTGWLPLYSPGGVAGSLNGHPAARGN